MLSFVATIILRSYFDGVFYDYSGALPAREARVGGAP